jgi:hypothetical protein
MAAIHYTVRARWDDEAKLWSTDGDDIPGLVCEAGSFDQLVKVVLDLAPALLQVNGGEASDVVDIKVVAARFGPAR